MDKYSKNVCLIGVLHIIVYVVFILEPLSRLVEILTTPEEEISTYDRDPFIHLIFIGILFTLIVLSGLMIRGVKKQNYLLIAPFLIASVLILSIMILIFCKLMLSHYYGEPLYGLLISLHTLCVQIMTIYPIYTLCMELRSVAKKEKSLKQDLSDQQKKPINAEIPCITIN